LRNVKPAIPHTGGPLELNGFWFEDCHSLNVVSKLLVGAFLCLLLFDCTGRSRADQGIGTGIPLSTAQRIGDTIQFAPDSAQLKQIQVADVKVERIPIDEVVAPGHIEANPNRVSRIALPVAGRVSKVLVGLGDAVRENQPLILMESSEIPALQAAYRRAEADVSQSQAALAKAEADLKRVRDLFENKAIAQKEVISAESEAARARASLAQAEATSEEAVQQLRILGIVPGSADRTVTVRATVSGKVIEINVAPGEYRNDTSQPVMTLADLSTVWVAADVPESAIGLVKVGGPVAITFPAFPDRTFSGNVKRIGDTVDKETRTIKVRVELLNPKGDFRPDMFAQVRSDRGSRNLSCVPTKAVLQEEGKNLVYVERGPGTFQEVPVTVVKQGTSQVAIADGIHPGDRVVTSGAMLLRAAVP
jgi:cobalt-zinc-cadmium efflux system membrane fusion protein